MGGKQSQSSKEPIKMPPIPGPSPQNDLPSSSETRGNSFAQNQKVSEVSQVPWKYINSLGFIDYNHYGQVPWPKGEINLPREFTSVTQLLAIDCEMVGVGPLAIS